MKRILVIGSGGREHALAWKLSQSEHTDTVYVAPGNAGTAREANVENIDISSDDIRALLAFVADNGIDLTIVGPEAPLVAGIVDEFTASGHPILGPRKFNAQLEGSKAFAKQFMQQFSIPTASYSEFIEPKSAIEYVQQNTLPIVIKADGLAAGKGVVIAQSEQEAITTIESMLSGSAHGDAGKKIVIEEFLQGEEVSFICLVDHDTVVPLASSQDHKARDNGDRGPNTGGMGAYSPAPIVSPALHEQILEQVIYPTVNGFIQLGHPYQGFLYAGLMISPSGIPKVLEFNCRFGDPETQPIMLRLQNDFSELCNLAANHQLQTTNLDWDPRSALGVVMAAGGYPFDYAKGESISGLNDADNETVKVFHAGTEQQNDEVKTNGGRVLCVTALGDDIQTAQHSAYDAVKKITWKDAYYRTDIGYRAIK